MLVYAVDGDSSTIQSRHQLYASHPNQHVNDMRTAQMAPNGFLAALRGMVSTTDLAVNSRRKLLFPVGLLVLITVATIGATLFVGAKEQDEIAISSSINLAGSILRKMEVDLGLLVLDYTFWDEAIENLIIEPNMSWAPRNIGWYLEENFDMSATVVLSGSNETDLCRGRWHGSTERKNRKFWTWLGRRCCPKFGCPAAMENRLQRQVFSYSTE